MKQPQNILLLLPTVLAACGGPSSESDGLECGPGTHVVGNVCAADGGGTGGTAGDATGGTGNTTGTGGDVATGGSGEDTGGTPGTGGGSGSVGVVGDSCGTPGALACAGNFQKLTVVCGASGEWEVNQTCGADEFCDSTPGPNVGLCAQPHPDCVGKGPGDVVCGDGVSYQCGPDNITTVEMSDCDASCGSACWTEPCPDTSEIVVINCDPTCGEISEQCPEPYVDCTPWDGAPQFIHTEDLTSDTVIRIPAGGAGCSCEDPEVQYFVAFNIRTGWKAQVAPPWKIENINSGACAPANFSHACVSVPTDREYTQQVAVRALGPGAPAVNLYLSLSETGC